MKIDLKDYINFLITGEKPTNSTIYSTRLAPTYLNINKVDFIENPHKDAPLISKNLKKMQVKFKEMNIVYNEVEKYEKNEFITVGDLRKIIASVQGIHKFRVADIEIDFTEKLIIKLLIY